MIKQLAPLAQEALTELLKKEPLLSAVDAIVRQEKGRVFLVGGIVRALIMQQSAPALMQMDIDVEVHGISLEQLQIILASYGVVNLLGASFGVLRIVGTSIDWSVPRYDYAGRKPEVILVADLPISQALRRRDLTINAMAIEIATGLLYDPFDGCADILARRLRTPDPAFFVQDPLRFYRVMQFISRLDMLPDDELNLLCQKIDLTAIARERIIAEFEKLLLSSKIPSKGLRWLARIDRLTEILPELGATQGILQDITWHPEGDVFEHTMQAIDAAALVTYPTDYERRLILYATLCHDLGKVSTTRIIQDRIRSLGHEEASVAPTRTLLNRIAQNEKMMRTVMLLVRHHMAPVQFASQQAGPRAYKQLAYSLAPSATLHQLALLAYADKRGRNGTCGVPLNMALPDIDLFIERASAFGVLHAPEKPLLSGEDIAGDISAGPERGAILKKAYQIQINEGIVDKEYLRRRVLSKNR